MRHPEHPLIEFLAYFALALMVLAMLAVGIVLMLVFTAVDGVSRGVARLRGKEKGA